jgi:hypothetical protein
MKYKSKLKIIPMILAAIFFAKIEGSLLATPYASCITNISGTVSFILNESADNVKIVFDGGGAGNTNDMGALTKGTTNFSLGAHSTWQIHVTKATPTSWIRISDNTNKYNQYYAPSGVAVNRNPADLSRFGRIYVAESVGGTSTTHGTRLDGEGIYVVNPDFTDALGYDDTAKTGGLTFLPGDSAATTGQRSPWRIEVGQDNNVYIADWSGTNGTLFRIDQDLITGETVLAGVGVLNWNSSVHTTISSSPIVKGSLAGNNLQVWAVDGRWPTGGFNRLLRWDINGTPLPYNSAPAAQLRTAGVPSVADISADLDIAPDGKFFLTSFRATGTANVYDPDRVNIRVLNTDGLTVLWDSLSNSLAIGLTTDAFANSRSIAVSPDNKKVAITKNDTHVWIMNLTNGIPDITTRTNITAFLDGAGAPYTSTSTSADSRRDVAFDAAGNFYSGNQNVEVIVVWSPGGTKTAITKSDGTFLVESPQTVVNITATTSTANEQGPTNGVFTLTRTGGDSSGSLTIPYTVTGTATPGADYTTLSGTATFLPGATSTNITVAVTHDTVAEFTETVVLTLSGSPNYGLGTGAATVSILDNESPEVSFTPSTPKKLLEGYATSKVIHQVVRRGLLTPALTVNLSYSGTATVGVDFSAPSTVALAASAASANVTLTSTNDQSFEGDEIATVTIASGSGYSAGATNSISTTVVDDETPTGTVLFSDNFETDSSANWIVNVANPSDAFVDFAYDYGTNTVGIPPAPGSSTTKGMRFRCGNTILVTDAVSVSPLNGNFTGDYRVKFNMWINYNGPLPDGGPGSTQNFDAGVGTTGDRVVWHNNPEADGVWFSATGDGAAFDDRIGDYTALIGPVVQTGPSGFYAGGTNSGIQFETNSYYAYWGGVTAPAAQLTLFPGQTGVANTGNAGMAWHSVVIEKQADTVKWIIDGIPIATVTNDPGSLSTNVFVGYLDAFASGSLSDVPAMSFGLVDNFRVETFSAPATPVITSIQVVGSTVTINFTAGAGDSSAAFTLMSRGTVDGAEGIAGGANITGSSGVFQATVLVNGSTQFYRIKR